ncbi:MAG: tetratricopeptide repeat protein [Heliobacteriaceae bacterium]|jgi:tetratricopeptide (TPR) repeat protein|nr:tetratricopeptide repeat protein [Heliobacteriaceae bacterium]
MDEINRLIAQKDFNQAKELLNGLLQADNIEALELHGICSINLGLFDEAKKDFETVVKFKRNDALSWFYLANCYDNLQDFLHAGAAYEEAIKLKEDYIDAYKNLCVIHVKSGEPQKAVELGKKALEYGSDHTLFYIIGTACMSLKKFDESILYLEKALELNADHAQLYNNLGTCFISTGNMEKAYESFSKASELEPENSLAYFNIASILQIQNKHKEACGFFQKAYDIEPNDGYLVAMALSEVKMEDYGSAISHYKILIEHNPEKHNYRYNLACCYEAAGDYSYAAGILAHLVMLNPKSVTMMQKLANIYIKLERPMNAKELYERIITQGNTSYEIYYEFAYVCVKTNDMDRAEKMLKKVIELNPGFAPAHKDLGVIYLQRRQFDYAKDEFAKAVQTAPDNFDVLFEYANFFQATADFQKADEFYQKALAVEPGNVDALGFSALNKIHTKDFDTALAQVEKAIEAVHDDSFLYYIAGRLKYLKRQFEDAKQYLIRSFELNPMSDAQNLLGLCYYELGNYSQAKEIFDSLLSSSPVNVNLLLSIARCCEKLGEANAALAHLDRAVEIFPECEEAHDLIRQLS